MRYGRVAGGPASTAGPCRLDTAPGISVAADLSADRGRAASEQSGQTAATELVDQAYLDSGALDSAEFMI